MSLTKKINLDSHCTNSRSLSIEKYGTFHVYGSLVRKILIG